MHKNIICTSTVNDEYYECIFIFILTNREPFHFAEVINHFNYFKVINIPIFHYVVSRCELTS